MILFKKIADLLCYVMLCFVFFVVLCFAFQGITILIIFVFLIIIMMRIVNVLTTIFSSENFHGLPSK